MGVRSTGAKSKGYIRNVSTGETKAFMLNPTTFSESRSVTYNTVNGVGGAYPLIEFSAGGATTIPLEIYLRGDYGEVNDWVKWLKSFCPTKSRRTKFAPPPQLTFALGKFSADCVMTSIDVKYTMFDDKSRPIEATVSVKLMEVV